MVGGGHKVEFCSWVCRRQDSGKYMVEMMKEGQTRVQVKKRRSESLPELLFMNTSDEE